MSRTFTLLCRTSLLLAVVLLGLITPTAQAQQIDLKETMNKAQYYVAPLTTADPGGSNCDGGEHYDDGTIENGYSGNPSLINDVDVVMLFTPASYPLVYNEVCFILVSLGGPTLTFDVVIYDDDGTGGEPGTLLYSETYSLTDVPGGINSQIYTFELTSPPSITSGSVYIGASWNPMSFPSRFLGSDESPATSLRSGYVRFQPNDPANWQATHTVFPGYKAMAVRAASTVSIEIDLSLEQEGTLLGDHVAAWNLAVHNAGSSDATGVQVTDYVLGYASITDWETSHGTFNPSSGLWTVGDLLIDETATLEVLTTLDAAGLYENCAEVTAANESDVDSTPGDGEGDDYACTSAFLPGTRPGPNFERGVGEVLVRGGRRFTSDLDVDLAASDDSPAAGDEITLTVEAINVGPQVNGGVKVELSLDECLSPIASSASRGSYADGTWSIGTLPVGTAILELSVEVGACGGETEVKAAISGNLPNPNDNPLNPFEENTDDEDEATLTLTVAAAEGRVAQLEAAYPNPFNPQTVIPFELRKAAHVQVAIYDMLGRRVAVLAAGQLAAGHHEAVFTADSLPTGTYLVRLEAAGETQTQRIVLMK